MKLSRYLCSAALCAVSAFGAEDPSRQAAQAMREGRYAEAERIYRQLVQAAPKDAPLHLNLGLALHSARKYNEALKEFNQFLQLQPQPGPAHLLAGVAHLKLKQPCEAISPLEKARVWRASAQVLIELGDAYQGCRRFSSAAQAYSAALGSEPANVRLRHAAARAFWQAREYEKAKPLYARLAQGFQTNAEFLFEYGDTLARLDGTAAGLPLLEQAVRLNPELVPARGALGRALVDAGRAAEAVPHLEAAAPADETLLMPLSRAYKATGRVEDAARAEADYRRRLASQN